jgi:hypothetical protein
MSSWTAWRFSAVTVCGFGSMPSFNNPRPKVSRDSVRKLTRLAGRAYRSTRLFGSALPAFARTPLL